MNGILVASFFLYVSSLVAWLILRALMGDESYLVLLLNYFGIWLFSPILVFGPWAIIGKQKTIISILLFPTSLFLFFYGPLLFPLPRYSPAASTRTHFTVMTFNVRTGNSNLASILNVINSSQADVFALQEITTAHQEQMNLKLGRKYAYHSYNPWNNLAIYSIYPFIEQDNYFPTTMPIQSVTLEINDKPVRIINSHLTKVGLVPFLNTRNLNQLREFRDSREDQIILINKMIQESGSPVIVTCDCNMTDLNSSYSLITSELRDAFQEGGWGFGHSFLVPRGFGIASSINLRFQRIDYIFHSPEIRTHQAGLINLDSGSDHLALYAQLEW